MNVLRSKPTALQTLRDVFPPNVVTPKPKRPQKGTSITYPGFSRWNALLVQLQQNFQGSVRNLLTEGVSDFPQQLTLFLKKKRKELKVVKNFPRVQKFCFFHLCFDDRDPQTLSDFSSAVSFFGFFAEPLPPFPFFLFALQRNVTS